MTKEELLALLDEAETEEEIATIGRQLLELDPQSPYGKLAIWGTLGAVWLNPFHYIIKK